MTNDAWFGDSTAPHQHLDISRMRTLESGRAMLRATNDGVTALDRPRRVGARAACPSSSPRVLTGLVQPRDGLTPYVRFGNTPLLAIVLAGLAAAWSTGRRGREPAMNEHRGAITHEGEAYPSPRHALDYLDMDPPAPGHAQPVGDRLWWARIPSPMELHHVNVWLLDDGDGWTLVDTGMPEDVCRAAWGTLEASPSISAAGRCDASSSRTTTPTTWGCRTGSRTGRGPRPLDVGVRRRRGGGASRQRRRSSMPRPARAHALTRSSSRLRMCGEVGVGRTRQGWIQSLPPLAPACADGDMFAAGDREWDVIETDGHCRGHLCLHDAANDVLISGDQVLPTISRT